MALENQKASYTINVERTGDGATQAVNEFRAVEAAAKKTNTTLATNTTAMNTVTSTTKTATSSLKAMQGTLQLIGLQTFPELTLAATTAQSAITGIKTAAEATGVSMAVLGGQIAVIAAGLYKIVEAVQEWRNMVGAQAEEVTATENLTAQVQEQAERMKDVVSELIATGRMAESEGTALFDWLLNPSPEGNRAVQERVRAIQDQIRAEKELMALKSEAFIDTLGPGARERLAEGAVFGDRMRKIAELKTRIGDLPGGDPDLAAKAEEQAEAAHKALQRRWAEANKQLTEMQRLGGEVRDMFATGLSTAIVDAFRNGKNAGEIFKAFLSDLAGSVAQLVLKMLILKAVSSIFGAATGSDAGTGADGQMAASGGFFPRMMGSGGMAGVSSVSSPTYFPRFNVIAGEAGREMMTVLARPRMMDIGGMQAVVGSAQGNTLAITSASALAGRGGGAGGMVDIRVTLGPELRAEIVNQSVEGARVTVANDMRSDTPISRGVKGLTA